MANKLGRFQPCAGPCCFNPGSCEECGPTLANGFWLDLPAFDGGWCGDSNCIQSEQTVWIPTGGACQSDTVQVIIPCGEVGNALYDLAVKYIYSEPPPACLCQCSLKVVNEPPGADEHYWELSISTLEDVLDFYLPFAREFTTTPGNPLNCLATGTTVHIYE